MADATGRPSVRVRSVSCPNCGAATAVRTFGHAVNVVCQSCGFVLDAKDPGVTILQRFKEAIRFEPLIPLGTRGKVLGTEFEAVGFQVRQITVDGTHYRWREYLLFNPYQGFRYITEYAGHWNVVSTLRSLPGGGATPEGSSSRRYEGRTYRHFQTATATTIFVLGEFPWQIRVGEQATVTDYVAPPRILSAEVNADKEVTWSLGQYVDGSEIWTGFGLPDHPPKPEGVFADQPSPFAGMSGTMWRRAVQLMALAAIIWIVHLATARGKQAFAEVYGYDPRVVGDTSLVTPVFELDGRPSAVRIETVTNLDNQWMDVGYALINDDTGQSYEFAREVSNYHGFEDGEAWREGSPADAVTLPQIPPGRYFLRIEPEGDRTGTPVRYTVTVVRDVPTSLWFVGALILLALPPVTISWRAFGFERARWNESDHAWGGSSSGGGDAEDDD